MYGVATCPPLALEAGWAYLEEREEAGDFAIPDAGGVRTEYWKRFREMKPRPAAEIDGAAALAQTPGEYRKQQMLEFGRRGRVPPAPPP